MHQLLSFPGQAGSKLVKQPSPKVARFAVERLPLHHGAWGFVKVPVSSKRHLSFQRPLVQDEISELQRLYEAALLEEEEQRAMLARHEASMSHLTAVLSIREAQQHAAKSMLHELNELHLQSVGIMVQQPMLDFQEEVYMCGRKAVPMEPGGTAVSRPAAAWRHSMVDDMTHHVHHLTSALCTALKQPAPPYDPTHDEPKMYSNVLPYALAKHSTVESA